MVFDCMTLYEGQAQNHKDVNSDTCNEVDKLLNISAFKSVPVNMYSLKLNLQYVA